MTTKRSEFGSLADRTSGGAVRSEPPRAVVERSLPAGVHVWVRDDLEEAPALLFGWMRSPEGWWGRVITITDGQPVESLIRGDQLRKAESS